MSMHVSIRYIMYVYVYIYMQPAIYDIELIVNPIVYKAQTPGLDAAHRNLGRNERNPEPRVLGLL